MTIAEIRALADRSGYTVAKQPEGYVLTEDGNEGRFVPNKDGSPWHRSADELFESLTERS